MSLLRFGSDVKPPGTQFQVLPFVIPQGLHHYYVELKDISINGWPMMFSNRTFELRRDGTGGTILDSGATVTSIGRKTFDKVIQQLIFPNLDFKGITI